MNAIKSLTSSLIKSVFNKDKPTLIKPISTRRSEFSILREIVEKSKLNTATAINIVNMWKSAEKQIKTFLNTSEMEISDVIYLPDKSGVIRVILNKEPEQVIVKHVDVIPPGSPKEFAVPIYVQRSRY